MQSFSSVDRNNLIQKGWDKLKEKCRHHEGDDPNHSGYDLCSENDNTGTVVQVKGLRRCNILCCAHAGKVHSYVQKVLDRNAKQRDKEETIREMTMESEELATRAVRQKNKAIDLTDFVSEDSLQYAQ